MDSLRRIQTGDWVGATWQGPYWTPFAQAIADDYANQVPWFFNSLITLGPTPTRQTSLTPPQENDILIFGAHVQSTTPERLPFAYLNITHKESGVPWAAPTVLPFFPVTAIAGVNGNITSNLKLPEAFFLPAHTQLKLDWTLLAAPVFEDSTTLTLTLIGVQLVRPRGGMAPEKVTMPNGQQVRTDERLPLFMTMGLGELQVGAGTTLFLFTDLDTQRIQYIPALNCNAEIHDLTTNIISEAFDFSVGLPEPPIAGAAAVNLKITVMGAENQWTPYYSPIATVFGGPGGGAGDTTQIYPALPYTKPYLLPKGRRIQVAQQNTNGSFDITNGMLTFRGVRLCEY